MYLRSQSFFLNPIHQVLFHFYGMTSCISICEVNSLQLRAVIITVPRIHPRPLVLAGREGDAISKDISRLVVLGKSPSHLTPFGHFVWPTIMTPFIQYHLHYYRKSVGLKHDYWKKAKFTDHAIFKLYETNIYSIKHGMFQVKFHENLTQEKQSLWSKAGSVMKNSVLKGIRVMKVWGGKSYFPGSTLCCF